MAGQDPNPYEQQGNVPLTPEAQERARLEKLERHEKTMKGVERRIWELWAFHDTETILAVTPPEVKRDIKASFVEALHRVPWRNNEHQEQGVQVKHAMTAEEKPQHQPEVQPSTQDLLRQLRQSHEWLTQQEVSDAKREIVFQHLKKHKASFEKWNIDLSKLWLSDSIIKDAIESFVSHEYNNPQLEHVVNGWKWNSPLVAFIDSHVNLDIKEGTKPDIFTILLVFKAKNLKQYLSPGTKECILNKQTLHILAEGKKIPPALEGFAETKIWKQLIKSSESYHGRVKLLRDFQFDPKSPEHTKKAAGFFQEYQKIEQHLNDEAKILAEALEKWKITEADAMASLDNPRENRRLADRIRIPWMRFEQEFEKWVYSLNVQYIATLLACKPLPECVQMKSKIKSPIQVVIGWKAQTIEMELDFSHYDPSKTPEENASNIMRSSGWQKFKDKMSDAWQETLLRPGKWALLLGSIALAGLVTFWVDVLSEWSSVAMSGTIFTLSEKLFRGLSMWAYAKYNDEGEFGQTFAKEVWVLDKDWETMSVGRFAIQQAFDFGLGIASMGTIGKFWSAMEWAMFKWMEAWPLKTFMVKTSSLFAETGIITGANLWVDTLREWVLRSEEDAANLLMNNLKGENLAMSLVHNLMFVWVLRWANRVWKSWAQQALSWAIRNEYDYMARMRIEFQVDVSGNGVIFTKNGKPLAENAPEYKRLQSFRDKLARVNLGVIGKKNMNDPDIQQQYQQEQGRVLVKWALEHKIKLTEVKSKKLNASVDRAEARGERLEDTFQGLQTRAKEIETSLGDLEWEQKSLLEDLERRLAVIRDKVVKWIPKELEKKRQTWLKKLEKHLDPERQWLISQLEIEIENSRIVTERGLERHINEQRSEWQEKIAKTLEIKRNRIEQSLVVLKGKLEVTKAKIAWLTSQKDTDTTLLRSYSQQQEQIEKQIDQFNRQLANLGRSPKIPDVEGGETPWNAGVQSVASLMKDFAQNLNGVTIWDVAVGGGRTWKPEISAKFGKVREALGKAEKVEDLKWLVQEAVDDGLMRYIQERWIDVKALSEAQVAEIKIQRAKIIQDHIDRLTREFNQALRDWIQAQKKTEPGKESNLEVFKKYANFELFWKYMIECVKEMSPELKKSVQDYNNQDNSRISN